MTLSRGFVRNGATTPLDARQMDLARIVANVDGTPRVGVLGGGTAIVGAASTMEVAIFPGEFAVSKGRSDGVVILTNDGNTYVTVTPAPSANSRITVIWVRQQDNTTGDGASTAIFGTTDGVAAPSPTKPSIPLGALELATLRVYAGTTGANSSPNVLTNTYQMTAMRGGAVPFRTRVEMDAWTTPSPYQEAIVLSEATAGFNGRYVATPSGWRANTPATTRRYREAPYNMTNTLATLDLTGVDENSGDFVYSGGDFTCTQPGLYLLTAHLSAQAAGASVGFLGSLVVNSSEVAKASSVTNTIGAMSCSMQRTVRLNGLDSVRFQTFATEPIGMDVSPTATYVEFVRLGGW